MGVREEVRESYTYCDRCGCKFEPSKKENLQGIQKFELPIRPGRPWYKLAAVTRPRNSRGPSVLVSRVDLCDHCQWEFDVLFLQGRAVGWHPNRTPHEVPKNPHPAEPSA